MDVAVVDLAGKFAQFDDRWHPHIVGALNDMHVKVVKLEGEFVWHHHDEEDELFLVVAGVLRMQFRDREVQVRAGQFVIVPRGVEHRPVADETAHVVLIEPASTRNTGNVRDARTVDEVDWL
jgi:mannose-6-phosphate isomerase-like protein (cupin superfamily)